ncbi:MAG: hypothetical protein OXU45_08435, partial [Candidatus Melainabacteria bacterium]|nr:hypothetical protein [Candidatus Melainabacteria bacterium]
IKIKPGQVARYFQREYTRFRLVNNLTYSSIEFICFMLFMTVLMLISPLCISWLAAIFSLFMSWNLTMAIKLIIAWLIIITFVR